MWRCGKETRCDPTCELQGSSGNTGLGRRLGEWGQACITDSSHAAAGRLEPLLTVQQSETSLMIDLATDYSSITSGGLLLDTYYGFERTYRNLTVLYGIHKCGVCLEGG